MSAKAPVYDRRFFQAMMGELRDLQDLLPKLQECAPKELADQLVAAVAAIGKSLKATKPIYKYGATPAGFGVSKVDKAIACDHAIAIIRQIKALKAW
jgi:hypothetical protein